MSPFYFIFVMILVHLIGMFCKFVKAAQSTAVAAITPNNKSHAEGQVTQDPLLPAFQKPRRTENFERESEIGKDITDDSSTRKRRSQQ